MIFDVYSIIGWIGMAIMILDYFLLSIKKLKSNSIQYNLLNIVGGLGLMVSSFYTKLWPVVALNVFWVAIAAFAIYKKTTIKIPYKELG